MNEDKLRNNIKAYIREMGIIILYAILSISIASLFNIIFCAVNMPPVISAENQKKFEEEYHARAVENPVYMAFGDIYLEYLGSYKYDYKMTSMSEFDNINEARQRILNSIAEDYSYYVGWSCLIALFLIRYLSKFIKWLYPKEQKHENTEQ
ncbi:MAG: hypothetical protein LBM07_02390 [Culturomica sp.]|jgi:hypothetical protein|nr:hypothetical protein [Culturomica sp.]